MTKQVINLGAASTGAGGDATRTAFSKCIDNFNELYDFGEGLLGKDISGGAGTVALTKIEARRMLVDLLGTITGDRVVTVPNDAIGTTVFRNSTSGNYAVTVKTASGAGVYMPPGMQARLVNDGTSISYADSGLYLGQQAFWASGTYTPRAGTRCVIVELIGAGGGGGGGVPTSASQFAAAGGGGAGGYLKALLRKNFSGKAVVVGAAGAGQTNGSGYTGGATSFDGQLVAGGGAGGGTAAASSSGTNAGGGAGGGVSFPNLASYAGQALASAVGGVGGFGTSSYSANMSIPGKGGDSYYGRGNSAGVGQDNAPGGGGAGVHSLPGYPSGATSYPGGQGAAFIHEFT